MNVSLTKDELQMLSDALFPFWVRTIVPVNDPKTTRTYVGLEKKLEKLLK